MATDKIDGKHYSSLHPLQDVCALCSQSAVGLDQSVILHLQAWIASLTSLFLFALSSDAHDHVLVDMRYVSIV